MQARALVCNFCNTFVFESGYEAKEKNNKF